MRTLSRRFSRRSKASETGLSAAWAGLTHNAYVQVAGIALVAPATFLLCLVVIAPFVYVIWESLLSGDPATVGVANYRWLFGSDFWTVFRHTLTIAVGSVVLELLVAVPLALLLNRRLFGRGALRALVTLPWAVPTIAVATAFLWLANTHYGLFNQIALSTGLLGEPLAILGEPDFALAAVTVAYAWKGLPLVLIIVLSALQSLPPEQLEAARVDGAWRRGQLQHVILPHLRSSIALAAVLSGIYNFALFDITYLLTGGGPAGATSTLPLLLYNQEFVALDTGRAAAVGVVIFLAGVVALALLAGAGVARRRRYA